MTKTEQFNLGRKMFLKGASYKACKNANVINGYAYEERMTRQGYTLEDWNKDGQGEHFANTRMKTFRDLSDSVLVKPF